MKTKSTFICYIYIILIEKKDDENIFVSVVDKFIYC